MEGKQRGMEPVLNLSLLWVTKTEFLPIYQYNIRQSSDENKENISLEIN